METPSSKSVNCDDNGDINVDDEFKMNLVKDVASMINAKRSLKLYWRKVTNKTGINCKLLWKNMQESTTNKLTTLLEANDLLKNVSPTMWLSTIDWMVFNLVLVHTKISVTNYNKLPRCINELFELAQEHKVENLVGDVLAEAWIRITLQYNKKERQCSPMLLQLRWYQLKELSRQQVYTPVTSQDYNKTKMLHAIAIKYQKIITQAYPKWETLIKDRRVILPEQFIEILNREERWKRVKVYDKLFLQSNQGTNSSSIIDLEAECDIDIIIDSDNESDAILCENEKSINSNALEGDKLICDKDVFNKVILTKPETVSNDKNDIMQLDDDKELDKMVQENIEFVSVDGSEIKPRDITENNEVGIKEEIIFEQIDIKEEKVVEHCDVFKKYDDINEDMTNLDDDVGLIDKKINERVKLELNAVYSSDVNDYREKINEGHIDLKLLKKAIVFTKKLDNMRVFKRIEYKFVNNKKVIECALSESKLVFKQPSEVKSEELTSQKVSDCQINNENKRNVSEKSYNTIKSTSWLLQKPKHRKYNSIQLRKNPDFNMDLKMLSHEFFTSTRNRILFKKCIPLTIDLHKQFEMKLTNGKVYVEGFKNCNFRATESKYSQQIAVSQSKTSHSIEKGRASDHSSINIARKVGESKSVSKRDTLSRRSSNKTDQVSSQSANKMLDDRRKIINLPNIDQIRKFNQSLKTAEVIPTRNETMHNASSSKQADASGSKPQEILQKTDVCTIKIKSEPMESHALENNKRLHEEHI